MPSLVKYFFDVPVYRLPQEHYQADQESYIQREMYPDERQKQFYERYPDQATSTRDHYWRGYGGCWRYNEIIGYIRLHFLGDQIRGEYFAVSAKRIVRTRRKIFESKAWKLAPEITIPAKASNQEIYDLVREYLRDCENELPRRYIDTKGLEEIGLFIDWQGLLNQ